MLNSYFQSQFNKDNQLVDKAACQTLKPPQVDIQDVAKLIQDLKPGKAPGPDGIHKEDLMIYIITQTASCLTMIFELEQGKLPLEWKSANTTPIHKSGATDSVKNYQPISFASIPCKILEHIVLRNLLAKVDKHLHNRQHGFSCVLHSDIKVSMLQSLTSRRYLTRYITHC